MARGRFVSKAISLDEKVDALSCDTVRLLFTWLIPHLDCEGRMHGDAQTVKSIVFPRRSMKPQTIEKYLVELEQQGLILRYSAPGGRYLCCPNFEKHQVGLRKTQESASQIPPSTTELKRGNIVLAPTQVKVKVKDKVYKENTKRKYGEFENILLTDEEYQKLKDKLEAEADRWIEEVSRGKAAKGYKYKSDYAAILNWQRRDKDSGKDKGRRLPNPEEYEPTPDYPDL